jgi:cysteine-rich repeat protein
MRGSGEPWVALLFFTAFVGCGDDAGAPADAAIDAAPDAAPDACVNCCGNHVVESGEACDDGNTSDFDGCSALCLWEKTLIVQTAALVPPPQGCDLDGNGTIDNVVSGALNDQARAFLDDFLTRRAFQGNPVVALLTMRGFDPLMAVPWRGAFYAGLDPQCPITNHYTGNASFLVLPATLDGAGQPRWSFLGSAPAGAFTTSPAATIVLPLPNRDVPELQEFAIATMTGTLTTDTTGPTQLAARLCGVQTAASFARVPDATGAQPPGATILDDLVLGEAFVGARITATQPDWDVDRDGLEIFRDTDGDHLIDLCIDGDGTQIIGRDCTQDPRIADGYSAAWDLTFVRAQLAGRAP